MIPKFKEFQFVEVDGTATGHGDLIGWISSVEDCTMLDDIYYNVRVYSGNVDSVYVAQKYIRETQRATDIERLMNSVPDQKNTTIAKATEIFEKHWTRATGKPLDEITRHHMKYAIEAIDEALNSPSVKGRFYTDYEIGIIKQEAWENGFSKGMD